MAGSRIGITTSKGLQSTRPPFVMSHSLFMIIYGHLLLGQLFLVTGIPPEITGNEKEYCESSTFDARCQADEVVVINSARYGRMRLGRCVTADLGYLGCYVDVRYLADRRCSGRRECSIGIPNTEFDNVNTCFKELKTFLEAGYSCVKVHAPSKDACLHANGNVLRTRSGTLSSYVTSETGCGSTRAPWVIEARKGQRINITLYDFSNYIPSRAGQKDTTMHESVRKSETQCIQYGVIEESTNNIRNALCGGRGRVRHVYLSRSNKVSIRVHIDRMSHNTSGHFLLKYNVIGCPVDVRKALQDGRDVSTIPNEDLVQCGYELQHDKNGKNSICDGPFVGPKLNCTNKGNSTIKFAQRDYSLKEGLSIALIVGITVAVSLLVLLAGAIFIKFGRTRRDDTINAEQLPVQHIRSHRGCTHETLYAGAPEGLYECRTFATIPSNTDCPKCLASHVRVEKCANYWDYPNEGTLMMSAESMYGSSIPPSAVLLDDLQRTVLRETDDEDAVDTSQQQNIANNAANSSSSSTGQYRDKYDACHYGQCVKPGSFETRKAQDPRTPSALKKPERT